MPQIQLESLAPVRRRGIQDIIVLITGLQAYESRANDFQVFTFAVVRKLGQLIERLASSEQEGNAREVLRQVRDTFLDGGWTSYRDEKTRQAVSALLDRHLGQVEEVGPATVKQALEELLALGLRPVPVLPGLLSSLGPAEEADGDERGAVSG
jgi:hypothetical protein